MNMKTKREKRDRREEREQGEREQRGGLKIGVLVVDEFVFPALIRALSYDL